MVAMRLADELSLATRLGQFSPNALKRMASTLGVQPRFGKAESHVSALAERIGGTEHRTLLIQKLGADEWAYLARFALRPYPFRLHALVYPLRQRGLDADAALDKLTHLCALGCILPYHLNLYNGAAITHLGIEPGAMRSTGLYATFTLAPGVGSWALERGGASYALAPSPPTTTIVEAQPTELLRAAFLVLAEAERKPIKLTTKGTIYKAELTRLAGALANVPTNAPKSVKKRVAIGEPPAILWFALAALNGANLLSAEADGLRPALDASGFFASSPEEQSRRLIEGWLSGPYDEFPRIPDLAGSITSSWGPAWTRPEPWFPVDGPTWGPSADNVLAARALILDLLRRVVARHPDEWYRLDELAKLVYDQDSELLFDRTDDYTLLMSPGALNVSASKPSDAYSTIVRANAPKGKAALSPDRDWIDVEGAFVRQVVGESMRWLGLVDVGPDDQRPDRFRLTPMARHLFYGSALPASETVAAPGGPPARIQPSFEVVVLDAFANGALVARLDSFAERQSFDRAATYRLTQEGLLRGLDRGMTGDEIIAFLESIGGGRLPQNVDFTLREWVRLYDSLTVREAATLLEADSAAQLDGWLADAAIAPLLGRRLGPTYILVPARHAARLAESLHRRKIRLAATDYAAAAPRVLRFVEPDRVVVPAEHLDPYLAHRLTRFATEIGRVKQNGTEQAIFQIMPDSVGAATASGWRADDIAEYLQSGASESLPVDFVTRLYGWGRAVAPLRYEPLVAIHLPAEPIGWDDLVQIPEIAPLVRLVPTPSVALVAPNDLDALVAALAVRGLTVKADTLSSEDLAGVPEEISANPIAEGFLRALSRELGGFQSSDLRLLPRRGQAPR